VAATSSPSLAPTSNPNVTELDAQCDPDSEPQPELVGAYRQPLHIKLAMTRGYWRVRFMTQLRFQVRPPS